MIRSLALLIYMMTISVLGMCAVRAAPLATNPDYIYYILGCVVVNLAVVCSFMQDKIKGK
jgi:hypothetical protein